ncbi:MAG: exodeoxyribonuclease VII large subunit [Hyphomicrobiales bacterium]|nr:exodeoxyribonuclease VII large subunit [Hyphomicrobiales bacterium]MCP5371123.1 exodeoxyribonuclease VII large subunit [Hyphomicrobiales bacterium]
MTQDPNIGAPATGPSSGNSGADHNLPVRTVGEISQAVKLTVEGAFARVRVRGEISGFKRAASGHLYFTLKDAEANLDGVCWRTSAGRLGIAPEDGMEVVATGRLTTYAGRSKYQMVVESLELAGEGALLRLLEDRRRALAAEGLFDAERKRPLPFLPEVIGVVTSPTGAVIRDILHRLGDRFPRRVLLWPVLVQGEGAAQQVAAAIRGFDALPPDGAIPRPDLVIVARGGGSLEDLWAFNEEVVVRAAAACTIPLISAVGHETDTTLIDFAADRRAPTPTAAAEMAVPVRAELMAQVLDDGARMAAALNRALQERRLRLEGLARGLPNLGRLTGEAAQRLDDWSERLDNGLAVGLAARRARLDRLAAGLTHPGRRIDQGRDRLAATARALDVAVRNLLRHRRTEATQLGALLESYSHRRVLERGFALVRDGAGEPVLAAAGVAPGMALSIQFRDGAVDAVARGGGAPPPAKPKPQPRRPKGGDDRQGELL